MAKFECRQYPNLGFYFNDERKKFKTGTYYTTNQKEIEFLKGLNDVKVIEEEKPKTQEKPAEETTTNQTQTQTKKSNSGGKKKKSPTKKQTTNTTSTSAQ